MQANKTSLSDTNPDRARILSRVSRRHHMLYSLSAEVKERHRHAVSCAVKFCFLPVSNKTELLAIPIVVVREEGEGTRLIPLREDGSRHTSCPRKCKPLPEERPQLAHEWSSDRNLTYDCFAAPKGLLTWVAESLGHTVEFPKKTPWHSLLVEMVIPHNYYQFDTLQSFSWLLDSRGRESLVLQVDFRDFKSVKEWRSPAILSDKTTKPKPKLFIDHEWEHTVSKAHDALRTWGENYVVPVDPVETLAADSPPPPQNSPVSLFHFAYCLSVLDC